MSGELVGITARWPILAVRGICAIAFGALTLLVPGISLVVLTLWFSAFAGVDGALALLTGLGAVGDHRHSLGLIAEGILGIAVSALVLAWPGVGIAGFVLLAGAWAILTGAALLLGALLLPLPAGKLLLVMAALLSMALGGLLMAYPVEGALILAIWLGAYALVSGVLMLASALRLRHAAEADEFG
jgi:uncharacterized membrane protein HdeD (DUF308 family)